MKDDEIKKAADSYALKFGFTEHEMVDYLSAAYQAGAKWAVEKTRREAIDEMIELAKQWDASDNYPNDLSEAIRALLKEKP